MKFKTLPRILGGKSAKFREWMEICSKTYLFFEVASSNFGLEWDILNHKDEIGGACMFYQGSAAREVQ